MKAVDETKKHKTPLGPWELRQIQTPYEGEQGPRIWTASVQVKTTDSNDIERQTK